MYKLTDLMLSEEILSQLNIDEALLFGGERSAQGFCPKEKITKKLNEHYQYHPKTFSTVNKGDLSLLKAVVVKYIHELKYL